MPPVVCMSLRAALEPRLPARRHAAEVCGVGRSADELCDAVVEVHARAARARLRVHRRGRRQGGDALHGGVGRRVPVLGAVARPAHLAVLLEKTQPRGERALAVVQGLGGGGHARHVRPLHGEWTQHRLEVSREAEGDGVGARRGALSLRLRALRLCEVPVRVQSELVREVVHRARTHAEVNRLRGRRGEAQRGAQQRLQAELLREELPPVRECVRVGQAAQHVPQQRRR
mmetsp:Transcript_10746/g.31949  ORF Transcript_10746/g.31949 Transcript_10746/m.31949 type:complete len:230 (+) Transcript_10746:100-789(+)